MDRSAFSPKELHREAALVLREGSSEFCALTAALSAALCCPCGRAAAMSVSRLFTCGVQVRSVATLEVCHLCEVQSRCKNCN